MSSRNSLGAASVLDPLPAVLDRLTTLATAVLGEHTNAFDLCAVCGSAWSCDQVLLADHNLAVL